MSFPVQVTKGTPHVISSSPSLNRDGNPAMTSRTLVGFMILGAFRAYARFRATPILSVGP